MAPSPAKRKIDRLVVNLVDRKDDGSDTGEVGKKYDHQQQKKEKKTAVAKSLKIWDLPVDLLVGEILAGLHRADRVHFGATCKKNYSLINNNDKILSRLCKEIDQLPWVATFSLNGAALVFTKEFKLYNPLHRCGQPPYANFKIKFPSEKGFNQLRITLIACKLGWLLFSWPNVASSTTSSTSFLLFCHFNKRLITLPDLKDGIDHAEREQYRVGSFSSCPSHGSCVYFLLTQNVVYGKVSISTLEQIKNGQWKTLVFDQLIHMIESVVYHDGLFYCVSSLNGWVAAYDHVHESWTMVIISSSPLLDMHRSFSLISCSNIIDFHGNLLLVRRGSSYSYNALHSVCRVFELCSSTKTWVQKTSLDGNAIFLGQYRCSSSFVVSSAPSDVANKIYFHGYINHCDYPMYYSLHTGQSYLCSNKTSCYWSTPIPGDGIWIPPPEIQLRNLLPLQRLNRV